jgi:hypothetical protein
MPTSQNRDMGHPADWSVWPLPEISNRIGSHKARHPIFLVPSPRRKQKVVNQLLLWDTPWQHFWSRANATFRSARGHWKTQSTTKHRTIDFGPALQSLPDGSFQPRIETQARIRGIDNRSATHPWVDSLDMQMFLDGFEAGARWYRSNPDWTIEKVDALKHGAEDYIRDKAASLFDRSFSRPFPF